MQKPIHSSVDALLKQALALHQQGQYEAAETHYRQVLQLQPKHFDAWNLLGVLAKQEGRPQRAIELIAQALAVDPSQAAAHCNMGTALQDLNRTEEALHYFDRALQLKPDYALALNNRGNALRKLQRFDEALSSYRQALSLKADYAEAFYNLGAMLYEMHRCEEAIHCYEQATRFKPDYADAWCNHGIALQELYRYQYALHSYERALRSNPQHAVAYCNLGTALQKLQRYQDALHSYDRALQIKPDFADAYLYRGNTLLVLMRTDEAIHSYRCALEHGSDPERTRYALAALGEEGQGEGPAASPVEYIKDLSDHYDHFDRHLQDVLHYQTPGMLVAAIREYGVIECDSVDLGCGTGLCGPLLRSFSRSLSGVDLSPNMLEKARQREVYDQLHCAELTEFLSQKTDCYDLAVAADVLVYIGNLLAVLKAVSRALRRGGVFAFSVEKNIDERDFVLRASHRFAHSTPYLTRLAQESGFVIVRMDEQILRHDDGGPINGYLVVLARAAPLAPVPAA